MGKEPIRCKCTHIAKDNALKFAEVQHVITAPKANLYGVDTITELCIGCSSNIVAAIMEVEGRRPRTI